MLPKECASALPGARTATPATAARFMARLLGMHFESAELRVRGVQLEGEAPAAVGRERELRRDARRQVRVQVVAVQVQLVGAVGGDAQGHDVALPDLDHIRARRETAAGDDELEDLA